MQRHLSTGSAVLAALMAAQRSAVPLDDVTQLLAMLERRNGRTGGLAETAAQRPSVAERAPRPRPGE